MHGSIPEAVAAFRTGLNRPHYAALAALGLGAVALISPQAAVLALATLGANALLAARPINLLSLAGPFFAALIVAAFVGLAGAIGVVFVWRVFADTSWSVAEARRLAQACGRAHETTRRILAHAWVTPAHGLALVAYTAPHMIAGLPLDLPHAPIWVPLATGALALAAVFDWALRCATQWRLGELAAQPAAHLFAHHAMFMLAFGLTLDVSAGVVAMLAWRLIHAARPQASLTAVP